MLCVPTARLLVLNVATPEFNIPDPRAAVPAMNVTSPEGNKHVARHGGSHGRGERDQLLQVSRDSAKRPVWQSNLQPAPPLGSLPLR